LQTTRSEEDDMPMIDLTLPEGALEPDARAKAVEKLAVALLRHEGAVDNQRSRALSWQFVHEIPADALSVGGAPTGVPFYRVRITVPSGTLLHGPGPVGAAARENLIREVTEILLEAEGGEKGSADAGRIWVIIDEISDGFWGGLGVPFYMRDIADFVLNEEGGAAHVQTAREVAGDLYPVPV
jgi:phenylpyruvate tautomerase PptA (4-oxalocrotonate tautomerase family)